MFAIEQQENKIKMLSCKLILKTTIKSYLVVNLHKSINISF